MIDEALMLLATAVSAMANMSVHIFMALCTYVVVAVESCFLMIGCGVFGPMSLPHQAEGVTQTDQLTTVTAAPTATATFAYREQARSYSGQPRVDRYCFDLKVYIEGDRS